MDIDKQLAPEAPSDHNHEISSPFVSVPSLPDDIVGVICRYLYPSISAYMRFVLSSRKWFNEASKCLDYIHIDEHIPAGAHVNVNPDTVVLCYLEPPIPKMLPNIMSSCKNLIMRRSVGHSFPHFVDISPFGHSFAAVEHLDISAISYPFNHVFPYLKSLRSCKISAEKDALRAIYQHSSTLRKLEIRHVSKAKVLTVENLAENLKSLTWIQELRLDPRQIDVSSSPTAPGISEPMVLKLQQCLPPQLKSLGCVHVSAADQTSITLPEYFFCLAASPVEWQTVCKSRIITEKLPDIAQFLRWAPHLSSESALDRFKHLLEHYSGQPLAPGPCNSITTSKITLGSILFAAMRVENKNMLAVLVDSVDWSMFTVEHLRDSNGFTPLHILPRNDDYWRRLYRKLKPIFPNILADCRNIHKRTVVPQLISDFVEEKNSPYSFTFGFLLEIFNLDKDAALVNNDLVALLVKLPTSSHYYTRDVYFDAIRVAVQREKDVGAFNPDCVAVQLHRWDEVVLFRIWSIMPEVIEANLGRLNSTTRTNLFKLVVQSASTPRTSRISLLNKFAKYEFNLALLTPILSTLLREDDVEFFWALVSFGVPVSQAQRSQDLHIPFFLANRSVMNLSDALQIHFEKLLDLYCRQGNQEACLYSLEAVCQSFMQDRCSSIRISKAQPECKLIDRLAEVTLRNLMEADMLNSLGTDALGMIHSDSLETLLFVLVGPWDLSFINMQERLGLARHIFAVLRRRRTELPSSLIVNSFDSGIEKPTHTDYDFTPKRRRQDQAFLVAAACAYTRAKNIDYKSLFQILFDDVCGVLATRKGLGSSWASVREVFLATGFEGDDAFRKMENVISKTFWSVKADPLKSFNPTSAYSGFGQRAPGFSTPLAFLPNECAAEIDSNDDEDVDSSFSD